jgi:hypothetical protein
MLPNAVVSKSRTNSKQRGEHRLGTTGAGGKLVGTTFYPSFVFDVRHDLFNLPYLSTRSKGILELL